MRKHTAILIVVISVLMVSACQPSTQAIQEAMTKTQNAQPTSTQEPTETPQPTATQTPTPKPTRAPTKTLKPTKTRTPKPFIINTPKPIKTPTKNLQSFLEFDGGYLTFDSEIWEVTSDNTITSRKYLDCKILTFYGHGYDGTKIDVVNEYDVYNDITFYFNEYRWKDTGEPAFTNVKWGPNQMYVVEVQSLESGWSCFQDALGVFWQSSLADFKK